jgi:hypothetical protein
MEQGLRAISAVVARQLALILAIDHRPLCEDYVAA